MWFVAIFACFPIVIAVVLRLQVASVWRRAAKELDGKFTKPRFADAFVCRDFTIDGTSSKMSVQLKTIEGHMPDDPNLSGGILGWIWDRLMARRSAYGVRIVVKPIKGVIPTQLTVRPRIRRDGRVSPKHWSEQVFVRGNSHGLLTPRRRSPVHRALVQHGAAVTGGVVILIRPGPLFSFANCRSIIKDMARAADAVTMSFDAWSTTLGAAPDTPEHGMTPVSVRKVRAHSSA